MTTPTARDFHIPYAEISRQLVAAQQRRPRPAQGVMAAQIQRTARSLSRSDRARGE